MNICITSGSGHGKTPLSAFDAALKDAGVANYNLIILSSIIPPNSIVELKRFNAKREDYGKRLYVVKAEKRSRETGKFVGATLGWYQIEDNRGVFVEHTTIGETEEVVRSILKKEVHDSLTDLCIFRKYPVIEEKMNMEIKVAEVKNHAVSALVIAVYKVEEW